MKNKITKQKSIENIYSTIPLILAISIVPIIVFAKHIVFDDVSASYWDGRKDYYDFFAYYKAFWIQILGLVSFCITCLYLFKKRITLKYIPLYLLIPITTYIILCFISSVLSKYPKQAYFGYPEIYEGLYVILSYFALFLSAALLINSLKHLKVLFGFLLASASIIGIIGVFQLFKLDIFKSIFGKKLILPKDLHNIVDTLNFKMLEGHIYTTLQNPNYVGLFFSILLVVSIALYLLADRKLLKATMAVLSILFFASLLGCRSTASFIGAAIGLLMIAIMLRKRIIKQWYYSIVPVAAIIGMLLIMNIYTQGYISQTFINKLNPVQPTPLIAANNGYITDFDINKNNLILNVGQNVLTVNFGKDNGYHFLDKDNKALTIITLQDSKYKLTDEHFSSIVFYSELNRLQITAPNTQFVVSVTESGDFQFINSSNKPIDLQTPPTFGFEGNEMWGSSRGYIWSRSIPMLKNNIIIGSGPDTFAMEFPQNEYPAKLKYLSNVYTLVSKPHNYYLQIALNTGLLSLVSLLVAFIGYLIWSIKLYFKPRATNEFYMFGITCMVAIIAFLVNSASADSTVITGQVFWILLGAGIACNRLYTKSISTHK